MPRAYPSTLILLTASVLFSAAASPHLFGRPGQPPRDRRADDAAALGVIRGRVTEADTHRPIRLARVSISPGQRGHQNVAHTDSDGRYELRAPPGRYAVSGFKAGYVTLEYGQRRVDERGTVVELVAGQTVTQINLALPRGGVLTGAVFDAYGDAVASATVRALRYRFASGRWQLFRTGRADGTDDRGMFRIYGLPPGDYYLQASFAAIWVDGLWHQP